MAKALSYNHQDIQRYLSQKMSGPEMHAFEQAMLDDPFLADAMEGYRHASRSVSEQHLAYIEKMVSTKKEDAKTVTSFASGSWWRVAAILLLVVAASVITYRITNSPANEGAQEIATTEAMAPPAKIDSIGPAEATVTTQHQAPPADLLAANTENPKSDIQHAPIASTPAKQQPEMVVLENEIESKAEKHAEAIVALQDSKMDASKNIAQSIAPAKEFFGKVTDPAGEPVPFASVRVKDKPTGTIADAKGSFMLLAPDSVIDVSIQSEGYASAETKLKSGDRNTAIVLRQEEPSLAEVVITGMSRSKVAGRKATKASPEPEGGWEAFYQYVNGKADSLKQRHSIEGAEVVCTFTINRDGRPQNIKVTNATTAEARQQAIYILQNGPRFTPAGSREAVRVKISF